LDLYHFLLQSVSGTANATTQHYHHYQEGTMYNEYCNVQEQDYIRKILIVDWDDVKVGDEIKRWNHIIIIMNESTTTTSSSMDPRVSLVVTKKNTDSSTDGNLEQANQKRANLKKIEESVVLVPYSSSCISTI
jgi:hypothetical protein